MSAAIKLHPAEEPLSHMDAAELTELIAHATAVRDSVTRQAQASFLARMQAEAKQLGMRLNKNLVAGYGDERPVRYRGPAGQEWKGLGRYPSWLKTEMAAGRKSSEFRV